MAKYGNMFGTDPTVPQAGQPSPPPVPASGGRYGSMFGETDTRDYNQKNADFVNGLYDSAGNWLGDKAKQAQGYAAGRFITGALTLGGRALQPFMAPQQLIFGAVKSLEDLAIDRDPQKAYEDIKTASKAALGYVTYGGYNGGNARTGGASDPRNHMILGRDMLKQAHAPDWLAKWGGLGLDFFLDVPLVGQLGKASKLGRILGTDAKFAQVFSNGTDLQKFAAHIIAAPMSNAPIPHLVAAIPEGNIGNLAGRTQMAKNIGNLIERGRSADPKDNLTGAVGASASEVFVSPSGRIPGLPSANLQDLKNTGMANGVGLPDAYRSIEDKARQVQANIAARLMSAGKAVEAAQKGLSPADKIEYTRIVNRLIDHKGSADQQHWRAELAKIANRQPDVAAFNARVTKALNQSTMADVFAAENLNKTGLMTPGELLAYQQGDKGHLRRMFSLWENPGAHIDRLRKAGTPASLTIDDAKLAGFFNAAISHPRNAGNPIRSSGAQMAADLKAMMTKPGEPGFPLLKTMENHGFKDTDIVHVLQELGGDYARKAGIKYVPDSFDLAESLRTYVAGTKQGFGGAGGIAAGSSARPIGQRQQLADYQLEGLGEIQDHMARVDRQGQVVGKIVSRRMIVQGYHDLMQKDGVILDRLPHAVTDTSGWRTVNEADAKALGLPQLNGKMIPAMFHRRLVDIIKTPETSIQSALWDWTAAAWRRAKLASPAAMGRNLASGFIAANQFGIPAHELLAGAVDYARLVAGAHKGDGIFDTQHKINGISMSELADHGEFIHGSMVHAEVAGPMQAFMDKVANETGSPFQKMIAGAAEFTAQVNQGQKGRLAQGALKVAALGGDVAGLGTGPITKFLSDNYGMIDAHMKGSIYMALRKKGMSAPDAAKHADEALFNYENVPYIVNTMRKAGIAGLPFASYQVLATGRAFKNAYERPYLLARNYRVPTSLSADQTEAGKANEYYASPDYIKGSLWVPVGKDEQGRPKYFNLSAILPESPTWDLGNSDNITNFEPPIIQLYKTIMDGKGYRGTPTYSAGGTYADTKAVNPDEAARGVLKAIWQFGASPWGPGQPMTDRLAKTIAAHAMTADQISDPGFQKFLKVTQEGPLVALSGVAHSAVAVQKKGAAAPQDILDAALRYAGITLQSIEPNYSEAGTGQSNLLGDKAQRKLLMTMMNDEGRKATTPEQRQEIRERYRRLVGNVQKKAQTQTGARKAAKAEGQP